MLAYYFDEMISERLAIAVRDTGIVVVRALELGLLDKDDDTAHLPTATSRDLVLFTFDRGFAGRASKRDDHAGLVCWTGNQKDIGGQRKELTQFAEENTPDDVRGRVFWLKADS